MHPPEDVLTWRRAARPQLSQVVFDDCEFVVLPGLQLPPGLRHLELSPEWLLPDAAAACAELLASGRYPAAAREQTAACLAALFRGLPMLEVRSCLLLYCRPGRCDCPGPGNRSCHDCCCWTLSLRAPSRWPDATWRLRV